MLVLSDICVLRKNLFRLVDFFVRMWLACDLKNLNLPEPVFENRFAAALFVLIFGISLVSLCIKIDGVNRHNKDAHALNRCVGLHLFLLLNQFAVIRFG